MFLIKINISSNDKIQEIHKKHNMSDYTNIFHLKCIIYLNIVNIIIQSHIKVILLFFLIQFLEYGWKLWRCSAVIKRTATATPTTTTATAAADATTTTTTTTDASTSDNATAATSSVATTGLDGSTTSALTAPAPSTNADTDSADAAARHTASPITSAPHRLPTTAATATAYAADATIQCLPVSAATAGDAPLPDPASSTAARNAGEGSYPAATHSVAAPSSRASTTRPDVAIRGSTSPAPSDAVTSYRHHARHDQFSGFGTRSKSSL